MFSIAIINSKRFPVTEETINYWLEISDEVIIVDKEHGRVNDSRVKTIVIENKLNPKVVLEMLCNTVKNEYFMVCSSSSKINGTNTEEFKSFIESGGFNVALMHYVCVVAGMQEAMDNHALEYTVFGKIYNKAVVDRIHAANKSTDDNIILNAMCIDPELQYLNTVFYYELNDKLYMKSLSCNDDAMFFNVLDRLPKERRRYIVQKWIRADKTRKEQERRIKVILSKSDIYDFAYQYTLKNRIVSRLKKLFVKEKK